MIPIANKNARTEADGQGKIITMLEQTYVLLEIFGDSPEADGATETEDFRFLEEFPSEAEANAERDGLNALADAGDPTHHGRRYITMSRLEYASMHH